MRGRSCFSSSGNTFSPLYYLIAFSLLRIPWVTAFQGPAVDLARDLGVIREIDDRLLAPLPVALVAVEKVLLAALRGLIGGAFIFPLAFWILGSAYQVRTDLLGVLIGLMVLLALCASFILCLWGGIKLFHRRVVS